MIRLTTAIEFVDYADHLVMRIEYGKFTANCSFLAAHLNKDNIFSQLKSMLCDLENLYAESKDNELENLQNNVKDALDKLLDWVNNKTEE